MRLALIPTFGASEKIHRQYTREFCGKPMIAWTIATALEHHVFDRVVVATGDEEVAEIARSHGADVPGLLPANIACDGFPPRAAMVHALDHLVADANAFKAVCCLNPVAPFLSIDDIVAGYERYEEGDCTFVFAVAGFSVPIQRALRIGSDGHVAMFQPVAFQTRARDLEEVWYDAGHFYWASPELWRKDTPVFGPDSVGIAVDRHRVQHIDSPEDWHVAELMYHAAKATS